jgi:hypothetical protein
MCGVDEVAILIARAAEEMAIVVSLRNIYTSSSSVL